MRDLPPRPADPYYAFPVQEADVDVVERAPSSVQQSRGYLVTEGSVAVDQSVDLRASRSCRRRHLLLSEACLRALAVLHSVTI